MFGGFLHRAVAPRAEHRRLSQIQFGDPVDTAFLELLTGTSKDSLGSRTSLRFRRMP
jgi:hypothetical protein